MCPPTQSIAAIPTFESTDRTTGMARTSPRPNDAAAPFARLRQPQADVVHLHDQGDDAVDAGGDRERDEHEDQRAREQRLVGDLVERDHHDLRREDEVGADRAADELRLRAPAPAR